MDFEVLWDGKINRFDDYGEALEFAKTMTFEEEVHNTALLVSIKKDDTIKIEGVHWMYGGCYVIEEWKF